MIRVGVQGGPLMHTLVDWQPRVKGAITEYWNGKDSDNLIDLYTNPNVRMIITYFSLPENSVIAFGNREMSYRQYKKAQNSVGTLKPDRGTVQENVSPHYRLPRTSDYAPRLAISFANAEKTESDLLIICVTHNLDEVFTLADRIAVLNNGRVEQFGSKEKIINSPRNHFVSNLLKSP